MPVKQKCWKIGFAPLGDGQYQVTVKRSGSVHRFNAKLPPDISDLWTTETKSAAGTRMFRSGVETMSPEAQFFGAGNLPTLKEIGERIMDAMLDVGNGSEGIKVLGALEDRVADSEGIELQFDLSQTPELSGIPWEAAYLKSKDRFLAIGTTSNVVRKLDAQSDLPPAVTRPIKILVAAANPFDDLNTGFELGNIERRIQELVDAGSGEFEIEALTDTTRDQFRRKVVDWEPHIIHYIGHSSFKDGSGYLYFESEKEKGKSDRVSAETLRNILLNKRPWVVVLNSCESGKTSSDHPMGGVAQDLLGRLNIPFVVGMQQPVSDDAAIAFSQDFYRALTDGETIASAVTMGRNAIATQADERTQIELITPALYTSGETDRIAFIGGASAGAAAAAVAAVADQPEKKSGGILSLLDTKLKIVSSIMASVVAIAGAGTLLYSQIYSAEESPSGPGDGLTGAQGQGTNGQSDTDQGSIDQGSTDQAATDRANSGQRSDSEDRPPARHPARNGSGPGGAVHVPSSFVDADGRTWVPVELERGQPAIRARRVATRPNQDSSPRSIEVTDLSANYAYAAVSPDAASRWHNPPPLPERVIAPAAGGEATAPPSWAEQLAGYEIPYCAGVRERIPFARGSDLPDPDFDQSSILWLNECNLNNIAFVGHIERAEIGDDYRGLGLRRAQNIAAQYEGLGDFLPGGVSVSGQGASVPVAPPSPETAPGEEAQNRRVDVVFNPICPVDYTIDARIEFYGDDLTIDPAGMSQLQALAAKIRPGESSTIYVTGSPARIGQDIFGLAQQRVLAVMAALPNMDDRNMHLVMPRLVDWRCPELLDPDPARDFITVEVDPLVVPETGSQLPEADPAQ